MTCVYIYIYTQVKQLLPLVAPVCDTVGLAPPPTSTSGPDTPHEDPSVANRSATSRSATNPSRCSAPTRVQRGLVLSSAGYAHTSLGASDTHHQDPSVCNSVAPTESGMLTGLVLSSAGYAHTSTPRPSARAVPRVTSSSVAPAADDAAAGGGGSRAAGMAAVVRVTLRVVV